jgi:hypothetical protein
MHLHFEFLIPLSTPKLTHVNLCRHVRVLSASDPHLQKDAFLSQLFICLTRARLGKTDPFE